MAHDYYMDIDHDQSSSQPSSDPIEGAHFRIPPPTNPELLRLREEWQSASKRSSSDREETCSAFPFPPNNPRVRQAGDPNHPARARASATHSSAEVSPSVAAAQDQYKGLVFDLEGTMNHRMHRMVAKSSKQRIKPVLPKAVEGGISKQYGKDPDVLSAATEMDQDDLPTARLSKVIARTIFRSRISDPGYDFPSSTPTPPAKERSRSTRGSPSSFSSPNVSTSSSGFDQSHSAGHMDTSGDAHETDFMDTTGEVPSTRPASPSSVNSEDNDASNNQRSEDERSPASRTVPEREPALVPYVSPPPLMGPPPVPLTRMPHPTPSIPTAPPPSTHVLPPLSRRFVAPTPTQGAASQSQRPRASQHPPPLGMLRRHAVSNKFQSKAKPFKVPFAVKKDPEKPAHNADPQPGSPGGEPERGRRSLSPVIPDPPYVVARAQRFEQSACEMPARKPEPRRVDDEDEGSKDADSSADLWASVPSLDDIGDLP
ncbi:hypothetical protein C8Q74DRAFT_1283009 [Fomes fomentarius]|nr:hypothetical protein C8Q74DRAFT_1283009 [Fomes fomentarius]